MLRSNRFLGALPPDVLDMLKPRLRASDFRAGQTLFLTDQKITHLYFMISGAVSLVCELADGQTVETAMLGRDSLIGGGAALDDSDAVHKAIVQVAGSGYALDAAHARQVARDSETFRTAIMRHEQLILAQAQQSAACNAAHSLEARLARWMLRVRDATGSDDFKITQEYIAEMLGVRRTSVSLAANTLMHAGVITYRRGSITLNDIQHLQAMACECYASVKTRYDALLQSDANAVQQHVEVRVASAPAATAAPSSRAPLATMFKPSSGNGR